MNAKRAADHEASHLVIGWMNGFPIHSVTINPPPGTAPGMAGACYTHRPDGSTVTGLPPEMLNTATAFMIMAGRVSSEIFHPGSSKTGWEQDMRGLAALMPLDDTTLEMHRYCTEHPGNTDGFYETFKGPVFRLLKSKRGSRAVKALSDALSAAGTLSGQAAVSVLEKSWGRPLPPKAIPLAGHVGITDGGPNSYEDILFNLQVYLRAMKADANRLQGELPESKANHLAGVRTYIRLLELEIARKIRKRPKPKDSSPPSGRCGAPGPG